MGDAAIKMDVVVVGGGFAGVYCGKELAARMRSREDFHAVIVSDENYTVFQPMLPSVAASGISPRHVVNPIRQLCRGIEVFKGSVARIDPVEKRIHLDAGDFSPNLVVEFKDLVLTVGAKVDLSRVPGMPEHALLMQNVGDAMKVRATILGRFEEANLVSDPEIKRRLLTFVVVGGGYAGVETAGEILDLMKDIHRYYRNVGPGDFGVVLIHSGERLLPTVPPDLSAYCLRILTKRGMRVILDTRVRAITANSVFLGDGSRIESSSVISTVGNGPHPLTLRLIDELKLPAERGRVRTLPNLRSEGCEWLWAAGDCAAVPFPGKPGEWCPPTAQFAQRQGTLMGRNICAVQSGGEPRDFKFTGLGELAAIGQFRAIAMIGPFKFHGFIAWWLWRTVYLSKLPGLNHKLRVVTDWTFDIFFPRDINILNPRYTRPLRDMHLEPGDVLFNSGEPAFSLYFVKEGTIEIRDGKRLVKAIHAGDYFGERALLEDRIWRYSAVAKTVCSLVALGASEFLAITEGSSTLKRLFTRSAQAYASSEDLHALMGQLDDATLDCPVDRLMKRSVDTLAPSMPLLDALALFRAKHHGSYPVVDDDGRLLGSVKRDALYDSIKIGELGDGKTVADLPREHLPTVRPSSKGREALEMLLRSGRNKLLVTDESDKLLGVLTVVDLMEDSLERQPAKARSGA